ncbi:MAG: hypothetical protein AAF211_08695 [Myxococcota bacterium]
MLRVGTVLVALSLFACNEADPGDDSPLPSPGPTGETDTGDFPSTPAPTGYGDYADCLFATEVVCFCQSCDTPDRRPTFDLYLQSCIDEGEYRDFVLCYLDLVDPYGNGQYGVDCPNSWKTCRDLLP